MIEQLTVLKRSVERYLELHLLLDRQGYKLKSVIPYGLKIVTSYIRHSVRCPIMVVYEVTLNSEEDMSEYKNLFAEAINESIKTGTL